MDLEKLSKEQLLDVYDFSLKVLQKNIKDESVGLDGLKNLLERISGLAVDRYKENNLENCASLRDKIYCIYYYGGDNRVLREIRKLAESMEV